MKNNLFIFIMIIATSLASEMITIYPQSDLYTDVEHAGTPNSLGELWVANYIPAGQFQRINLDFAISGFFSESIESITLNLTRFYSCPSSGSTLVRIYPIAEVWNEESWDITEHIAYYDDVYLEFMLSGPGGASIKEFHLEIKEIIDYLIENSLDFNGLVMIANNNQKFSKFYSKESNIEAYKPNLEIEYMSVNNTDYEVNNYDLDVNIYPNPFNPRTKIQFANPTNKAVKITIYDLKGRIVKEIKDNDRARDNSAFIWEGDNTENNQMSSGIYFCKIRVGSKEAIKKVMLRK